MVERLVSLKREMLSKKLSKPLSAADDEEFCEMVWAIDAIQSDREQFGAPFLTYPPEAATSDLRSKYSVYKWTLETLVNELLTTPKDPKLIARRGKLNCRQWDNAAVVGQALREIENYDDGIALDRTNVLDTMQRLAHRQVVWQREIASLKNMYRSVYLYGGPECGRYFLAEHGLLVPEFVHIGFAMYVHFDDQPKMPLQQEAREEGITPERIKATLALIARPRDELRSLAKALRSKRLHMGYRPSILRQFPCIAFGSRVRAPLRELVFQRVTTGLYYDVVKAGPATRNEIGKRFEDYCRELIAPTWPEFEAVPAFRYLPQGARKGSEIDAPDILLKKGGSTNVVIECKSKRMTIEARFDERPFETPSVQLGHDELAKGVFQIWRFISHGRRGLLPTYERVDPDAIGVVLTIEPWLTMTRGAHTPLMERAKALCASSGESFEEQDFVPIAFCPIEDLELLLPRSTHSSFVSTMRLAASDEHAGWHIHQLHKQFVEDGVTKKEYPFLNRVAELIPWWNVTVAP